MRRCLFLKNLKIPTANTIAKVLDYCLKWALHFPVLMALVCGNVPFLKTHTGKFYFTREFLVCAP